MMMDDLIIIIPTHNRQHYLNRVIKYYSTFPCKVYICDSSKAKGDAKSNGNIIYRWVPQSNFYGKVLDVLNETSADFYALSPDDDFLKQETLMECYGEIKKNPNLSMGTGKQIFFDEPFNGSLYLRPGANNLSGYRRMDGETDEDYMKRFWGHYQNILWSLFKKEVIKNAFTTLSLCNFKNGNFVEIILGIESLREGDVYVSANGLNYREVSKNEHWGSSIPSVTRENITKYSSIQNDIELFQKYYESDGEFATRSLEFYLDGDFRYRRNSYVSIIKSAIPEKLKRVIKTHMSSIFYTRKLTMVEDDIMSSRILSVI